VINTFAMVGLIIEFSVFVDGLLAAAFQNGGNSFFFGVHQVPVQGGVVEAEFFSKLVVEGRFSGIGIRVGGAQGQVAVAVRSAEVLVEERVGHERVDA
jgi:hypothetical protein